MSKSELSGAVKRQEKETDSSLFKKRVYHKGLTGKSHRHPETRKQSPAPCHLKNGTAKPETKATPLSQGESVAGSVNLLHSLASLYRTAFSVYSQFPLDSGLLH